MWILNRKLSLRHDCTTRWQNETSDFGENCVWKCMKILAIWCKSLVSTSFGRVSDSCSDLLLPGNWKWCHCCIFYPFPLYTTLKLISLAFCLLQPDASIVQQKEGNHGSQHGGGGSKCPTDRCLFMTETRWTRIRSVVASRCSHSTYEQLCRALDTNHCCCSRKTASKCYQWYPQHLRDNDL